jgi:hypothetical protein
VAWSEEWPGLVAFDELDTDDLLGVIGGWLSPETAKFLAVLFINEITNSSKWRT